MRPVNDFRRRIKERLDALGLSARQASIAAGLGDSFVRDILNGKSRQPSAESVARLAQVLRTTATYLLEGIGPAEKRLIPLRSFIGAGAVVMPFSDQDALEYIEIPPGADGVEAAAIVKGTSQLPALKDGDIVFWGEGSGDPSAFLGLECIVTLTDGRCLVKTVIAGAAPGLYTLLSHNAEPILDVAITAAAPVLWVKRSLSRG